MGQRTRYILRAKARYTRRAEVRDIVLGPDLRVNTGGIARNIRRAKARDIQRVGAHDSSGAGRWATIGGTFPDTFNGRKPDTFRGRLPATWLCRGIVPATLLGSELDTF